MPTKRSVLNLYDETNQSQLFQQKVTVDKVTLTTNSDYDIRAKVVNLYSQSGEQVLDAANKIITVIADVAAESSRAVAAEGVLTTDLAAEVTRASNAESTLQSNIDAENTRALGVEAGLQTSIDNEVTRATAAEGVLTTNLAQEVSDREAAVTAEQTRAQAAEAVNAAAIEQEVSDRQAAVTSAIAQEVSDRNAAIAVETVRAQGVEAGLDSRVETIETRNFVPYDNVTITGSTVQASSGSFPSAPMTSASQYGLTVSASSQRNAGVLGPQYAYFAFDSSTETGWDSNDLTYNSSGLPVSGVSTVVDGNAVAGEYIQVVFSSPSQLDGVSGLLHTAVLDYKIVYQSTEGGAWSLWHSVTNSTASFTHSLSPITAHAIRFIITRINGPSGYRLARIYNLRFSGVATSASQSLAVSSYGSDVSILTTYTNSSSNVENVLYSIKPLTSGVYGLGDDSHRFASLHSEAVLVGGKAVAIGEDLTAEVARATAAEGVLTSGLAQEVSDRQAAITQEVSDRNAAIAVETARATAAEGVNATAIAQEVSDRQAAITQEVSDRNAAIAVETARATAAEGVNATAIAQEVSDRQAAITQEVSDRNAAIAVETARAQGVEAGIRTDVDSANSKIDAVVAGASVDLDTLVEIVNAYQNADTNILSTIVTLQNNLTTVTAQLNALQLVVDTLTVE